MKRKSSSSSARRGQSSNSRSTSSSIERRTSSPAYSFREENRDNEYGYENDRNDRVSRGSRRYEDEDYGPMGRQEKRWMGSGVEDETDQRDPRDYRSSSYRDQNEDQYNYEMNSRSPRNFRDQNDTEEDYDRDFSSSARDNRRYSDENQNVPRRSSMRSPRYRSSRY